VLTATLRYGDVLGYKGVEPGDYLVTMRPAGSNDPPRVSRIVSVQPGTAYTVAAVRHTITPEDLGVFVDDLTAPPPGQARMRVLNAAPPAAQLDVRDAAGPVALGLPFAQASPYQDVAPGPMRLTVGPPGGTGTELPVTVAPNQVVSVVLTAASGGGPRATVVVDAGGPAVMPRGAVHAGFGGTAGRPGGPVASVVLLLLAAVAGGIALRLARRSDPA
jgi:transposase InsO family protein